MQDFKFETEDDLKADGFILTVNKFHTGNGDGKVYEKIVEGQRVFFGVDAEGSVATWSPASAQAMTDVVPPSVPAVEAEPAPTPSVETPASEPTE